ncbi:GntR family transcriptional regulator [Vagococcus carniphilus]|uniref:HTH gntR-type domain-containing protein n=1 Tax=Vagococcus carniphilus TaxID=218144 RepID=A0A430AWE7_9ENTE|nr:GntR family transcriptional regulator [Vagococcus carniphilus]QNN72177.1 GntR family transcriptional regulator [Vagococcus carniphilus]RSU12379.1 hypothetical protein CBF28_11110 [Vagococcus carniphilus]
MKNKKILYQEVSDSIKKDVIEGKYPINSYIPTENELEEMYNVSKITVRKAIQILCNEGYLVKQSGKGTEVISNRPFNILSKASSFTTILEKSGKQVEKKVLAAVETDLYSEENFKHDRIVEISRMFNISHEPAILFRHYISVPKHTDLTIVEQKNFSLYTFMASVGTQISYIDDEFSAEVVSEEIKQMLKLTKDFALKRIRKSYDKNNFLVEYTIAYYDTVKQAYVIDYEV